MDTSLKRKQNKTNPKLSIATNTSDLQEVFTCELFYFDSDTLILLISLGLVTL